MKCPNCGEEIKEGYLYCEKCGEDIHIVPDYEPEWELSLMQSVGEILDEEAKERELEKQLVLEKKRKLRKILLCGVVVILIGITALVSTKIIDFVKKTNNNSFTYQLEKAYACLGEGDTENALVFLERAVELEPADLGARLKLAEVYRILGNIDLYMEQFHAVKNASHATESELETAYRNLIEIYIDDQAYESINNLLQDCSNQEILDTYENFVVNPPEFSFAEGTYSEIIPLKMSADNAGTIYYTLDGSKPGTDSEKYEGPIFLETGSHRISALFVSEYGVVSEAVTKEYVIEVQKPAAPEVSVYSGEYKTPVSITVDVIEGCRVFYTTDGSYPTNQSQEYLTPIPMPLGKSYYKFIAYNEDGIAGDVTSREYKLTIESGVTVEKACQAVVDVMLQAGKIYNSLGESYQVNGKYSYIFEYPLAVPEKGDYYVIIEVYEDNSGIQIKTGAEFAVNIYDEKVYKFTNNNGNYLLEGF